MSARILATRAGTFPAAEGLESRPRTGRRDLRTVGIGHAGFDLIEEPFGFFGRAIETSRETVVHIIGNTHGFIHAAYLADRGDGQEHFMLPQAMLEGQVNNKCALAVIAFVKHAAVLYLAANEEPAAALIDLFAEILEFLLG